MALMMRPTKLSSPVDEDRKDFTAGARSISTFRMLRTRRPPAGFIER
jgi:hypothetical protein